MRMGRLANALWLVAMVDLSNYYDREQGVCQTALRIKLSHHVLERGASVGMGLRTHASTRGR